MSENEAKFHEDDRLFLNKMFEQPNIDLRQIFNKRLHDLGLSQRSALALLDIEQRTLLGILDGTQKRIDFLALTRLADFLELSIEKVVSSLLKKLEVNFKEELDEFRTREFILNNFDLDSLHDCGFLTSKTDFKYINERITSYFGFDSITEYNKEPISVAFSSGKRKPKNTLTKDFWVKSAAKNLRINNYYEYDRAKLLEYIPSIRWQTMNIKKGLFQVIRDLFKLGITVIFEPYISTLYVRGATLPINGKPAVVLTNYTNYYPSLWFGLMHELHHVLYDWEEIQGNCHISGELDLFSKVEVDADEFARECLFPIEKMRHVSPYINNQTFVSEYARANYIDPSLIYSFYCKENEVYDKKVWAKFSHLIPDISETVKALNGNPWQSRKSIKEFVKQREEGVFNGL